MRRPALHALILFTTGLLVGSFLDLPLVLLFSIFSLTVLFCLIFLLIKDKFSANLFIILALLLGGFFRYELQTRDFPPHHVSNFLNLNSEVTIAGRIVDQPDVRQDKTFITVEPERISLGEITHFVTGQIILRINESTFKFDYADDIEFKGYLNEPTPKRNPGAFDYKRYLNRKRIFGIVTLDGADKVEIVDKGKGNIFLSGIVIPLRRWILIVLESTLSGNHQGLLAGFLLGETRGISREVYIMFRDTGTVHLLAVSGSNVWLVIGVILGAFTLLRVPKLPATLAVLICILIFANLVHNDPPVVRAGIMAAMMLLGVLLYREVDLINVVSFAGLVILFFSPLFLFDVGFQLSFASVFGILLLYPPLSKLASRYASKSHRWFWKWMIMPALISVSVELLLFPILAYYFNTIPLVIVVANIFIVPLAGLSVVLACFTVFSAIFSSFVAGIFSAFNWLCLDLTLKLTEFFARLPLAKLSIAAPSTLSFILYYFLLWILFGSFASKKKVLLFSVLIIANVLIWKEGLSCDSRPFKVTFLDVNQGSSSVMELPNREIFLINAGEKGMNFDAGEQIVIPFLNHEGITEIDRMILTDTSPLNMNSSHWIAKDRQVNNVFLPFSSNLADGTYGNLLEGFSDKSVFMDSVDYMADEQNGLVIRLINYPETDESNLISNSILIKVVYKDVSLCLFDGMKEVHFDPKLDWDDLRGCSVLVLSELGDADEMRKVISNIKPQRIVFTRHYFRYERDKIPALMEIDFPEIEYYRTAENGAITCETNGERWSFDLSIN